MKKLLSLALVALMTFQTISLAAFSIAAQEVQQSKLTNKDVIEMSKSGTAEAIILAKINNSQTNFDTAPAALQELKTLGISDAIVLAMVQPAKNNVASIVASPVEVVVPDGTEIEVQLKNNLSGQEAKMGEVIDFTVVRPVLVNGVTVIEQGASAKGTITAAKKAGSWGKTGKLEWAMNDVQTVSGVRIPVRFVKATAGGSKAGTVAVAAIATTVLLGPLGLLWGFKKGKKAEIAAGNKYTIFVDGNSTIKTATPTL